jgi:hypothetical protein
VEVGAYLIRSAGRQGAAWLSPSTVGGLVAGVGVMYATAMLVTGASGATVRRWRVSRCR